MCVLFLCLVAFIPWPGSGNIVASASCVALVHLTVRATLEAILDHGVPGPHEDGRTGTLREQGLRSELLPLVPLGTHSLAQKEGGSTGGRAPAPRRDERAQVWSEGWTTEKTPRNAEVLT
ncbi:hypothetical protein Anapl_02079 [Anas platyrhynchos]|uniref:Secreted protein n=1 Tax=Anas platyrhynchos TaxID=8839 RepID=R0K665_ANAPL|nr:hypothetical protein Anapl_02079 [Anas platyrhynchos]